MCSMLVLQAVWSDTLCCGPSGSSTNRSVTHVVGGSKSSGTNITLLISPTLRRPVAARCPGSSPHRRMAKWLTTLRWFQNSR